MYIGFLSLSVLIPAGGEETKRETESRKVWPIASIPKGIQPSLPLSLSLGYHYQGYPKSKPLRASNNKLHNIHPLKFILFLKRAHFSTNIELSIKHEIYPTLFFRFVKLLRKDKIDIKLSLTTNRMTL